MTLDDIHFVGKDRGRMQRRTVFAIWKSKLSIDVSGLSARDTYGVTREEKQSHVGVIDSYTGSA